MRLDKEARRVLSETLIASGYERGSEGVDCLAFSKPTPEGNKAVHLRANETLLDVLVRNEPGPCFHVTGEMRALTDPFHRRLCAELSRQPNSRFTVLYDPRESDRNTPEGVGRQSARSWGSKHWADKISALNLIGEAIVDVRAYDTLDKIQYSVFGNRYVLLQEKHEDPVPKRVWLLKSLRLNEHLTDRAFRMSCEAHDIPEALFRRFSSRLNGITARLLLKALAAKRDRASDAEVLTDALQRFDPEAGLVLEDLIAIGFVNRVTSNSLCLTKTGEQYLRRAEVRLPDTRL